MKQSMALLVLLLAVAVTAAGCRRGGQPGGGASPSPAGATIAVSESEFKIEPATMTAAPGQVTFNVSNKGTQEHNFVVKLGDKELVRIDSIQVGQSKTVNVTLQAGEYKVLCDVPGHAEAGMVAALKVGP